LGAALEQNTKVTQLHLRAVDGLLCVVPSMSKTVPTTHSVTPLLKFIKVSPSLRKVKVSTNGCKADALAALTKLILGALLENPSKVAFTLDTWKFSSEAVTHLLGQATPSLVSLELSIHYDLGENVHAIGCAIAELADSSILHPTALGLDVTAIGGPWRHPSFADIQSQWE
jgi:hypothetical protein